MNSEDWKRAMFIASALVLISVGFLYWSSQEWLFSPPQTWLYYHQTLIASLIALLSVVGVWINAKLQVQAANEAESRNLERRQKQLGSTLSHLFAHYVHIMIAQHAHNRQGGDPIRSSILLEAFAPFHTEVALLPGEAGGATIIAYNNILFFNQEIEASENRVRKLEEEREFLTQRLLEKNKPASPIAADYQNRINQELEHYSKWHLEYLDKILPYMSQLCAWLECIKDGDLQEVSVPEMCERFGQAGNSYLLKWKHGPAIDENNRRMEADRARIK